MKAVLGQYYYAPHRNCWGVWQYDFVGDNCSSAKFIKDFHSKEDAREYVYEMNGWGKPKQRG